MEWSLALRIGLLLLGAMVVAGVYLFSTRRSKNRRRYPRDGRLRQIHTIDPIAAYSQRSATTGSPSSSSVSDQSSKQIAPETDVSLAGPSVLEAPVHDELPQVARTSEAPRSQGQGRRKKSTAQLEMSFDPDSGRTEFDEVSDPDLLTLYILPPEGHQFAGTPLVKALNSVGLRFGDMDIFHHFGAGELKTKEPLFSVANMIEPGSFKLSQIDKFATPGIVLFLQLPSPLDGAVSFELFLNSAQRISEALDGDLFSDPKTALDSIAIERMRQIASRH